MTEKLDSGKIEIMNLNKNLLSQLNLVKMLFTAAIICGFAAGIFILLQAGFLSQAIKDVFLNQKDLAGVMPLLWMILAIIIGRALISYLSEIITSLLAIKVKANLREKLITKIDQLGPRFTRQEQSSDLITAAIKGVETLDAYYSQYLPQIILAALVPLTFLTAVFPLDFLSALILLLTAPLIPFFMFLIGKNAENLTRQQWGALNRLSSFFYDTLKGLTTLKALNQSINQKETIRNVSQDYLSATMGVLRITFLSALVLELISTISTAVVAVQIGLRLLHGGIPFEESFFILLIAPEFYLPLRNLGLRFHAGMNGVSASKDIFRILNQPLPIESDQTKKDFAASGKNLEQIFSEDFRVVFNEVKFKYPNRNENALNGVNFELQKGTLTALVGPSGAGKSTTADLFLGFIKPLSGEIFLNDLPLTQISPTEWQKYITWVPQQPYLFREQFLKISNCPIRRHRKKKSWKPPVKPICTRLLKACPWDMTRG